MAAPVTMQSGSGKVVGGARAAFTSTTVQQDGARARVGGVTAAVGGNEAVPPHGLHMSRTFDNDIGFGMTGDANARQARAVDLGSKMTGLTATGRMGDSKSYIRRSQVGFNSTPHKLNTLHKKHEINAKIGNISQVFQATPAGTGELHSGKKVSEIYGTLSQEQIEKANSEGQNEYTI